MAYGFEDLILRMDNWGLSDVLLPFLLIFVVIFAILQKTKILGKNKKNYNTMFALVLALSVVIPHVTGRYPAGWDVVAILSQALPAISAIVVAVVMLLILIGVWGAESQWKGNNITGGIVILSALAVLYVFGAAAGWWRGWSRLNMYIGSDTISILVMILIFGLIIWFVTRDEEDSKNKSSGENLFKGLGDMFKKD